MSDSFLTGRSQPIPSEVLVATDNVSITGDGSGLRPLAAVAGGVAITTDGTLTGDGTDGSPLSASPIEFVPGRTLFVAKTWRSGLDPLFFFTTIAAAYTASIAMLPTSANPVQIVVFPGTYAEPITVVSNVHLVGAAQQQAVIVSGAVTYTPGAGVNAPQTATPELLNVCFIHFGAAWTIDSTGKASQRSGPVFRGCIMAGVTYTGQVALDVSIFFSCVFAGGAYSFSNVGSLTLFNVSTGAMTLALATVTNIAGCTLTGALTTSGTSVTRITGSAILAAVNVGAETQLTAAGCQITGVVTAAATGAADLRGSNYGGNGNLAGLGTIARTTYTGTSISTVADDTGVALAPAYPDASYNVQLQLVAGPGNAAATVTGKAGGGFNIHDTVHGNTWDYSVIYD